MSFNFEKAAKALKSSPVLELCTLAPSGGGKSFLAGTMGVKTLYIYGDGENHGITSAKITGKDLVVPFRWDVDDDGNEILSPDAQFKRLRDVVNDLEGLKAAGFGFVAIDSATEIELLIKSTQLFKNLCTHDKKYNNFKESESCVTMFKYLLKGLKKLAVAGIGYNMTLILDVVSLDDLGVIEEASPKLYGYKVAEGLIQQFPDIIIVSPIMNEETEETAHRIYFNSVVSKTQKDKNKRVKKTMNFNPRLAGLKIQDLPDESIKASLKTLLKLKLGK